jgi:hypothetical protein
VLGFENKEEKILNIQKSVENFINLMSKLKPPIVIVFSSTLSRKNVEMYINLLKLKSYIFAKWMWISEKNTVNFPIQSEDLKIILFGDVNTSFLTYFILSSYSCSVYPIF